MSKTVIVIEDEYSIREIETLLLRELGYTVLEASNGSEAALLLNIPHVDIAIVDYMIPGIEWIAFNYIKKLQAKFPDIKIAMCSARLKEELEEFAHYAEIDAVISKPFTIDRFIEVVKGFENQP